jgi:hypothetical protein
MDETDQPLETGHEPDTPVADTLLRRFLFNWAGCVEVLAASLGGQTLRRDDLWLADVGRPAGFANVATLLRPLTEASLDETLSSLEDFYGFGRGGKTGEATLFSAWPTPDLRPYGWCLMGHPPLHLLPAGAASPPSPPALRIEPVTDIAALRAFETAAVVGFPLPELQPYGAQAMIGDGALEDRRLRSWVGWLDGRAVSIGAAFVEHGINHVSLIATVPDARRRGYGEALTWRAALAEPELPAMLLSSDAGRPLYDRMGFLPLFRFTLWSRERDRHGD